MDQKYLESADSKPKRPSPNKQKIKRTKLKRTTTSTLSKNQRHSEKLCRTCSIKPWIRSTSNLQNLGSAPSARSASKKGRNLSSRPLVRSAIVPRGRQLLVTLTGVTV